VRNYICLTLWTLMQVWCCNTLIPLIALYLHDKQDVKNPFENNQSWKYSIIGKPQNPRWLIDYLRFYVPLKNFSLPLPVKGCKILAYARRLWAGRDLYCATPIVTQSLGGFSGLIRKTAPLSRPYTTHKGMWRTYSIPVLRGHISRRKRDLVEYIN
jgi:hypothetical protein